MAFRSSVRSAATGNATLLRSFHASARAARRLRPEIKLQPPIVPNIASIGVRDDHPLWQFFSDKKFIRSSEDLEQVGK